MLELALLRMPVLRTIPAQPLDSAFIDILCREVSPNGNFTELSLEFYEKILKRYPEFPGEDGRRITKEFLEGLRYQTLNLKLMNTSRVLKQTFIENKLKQDFFDHQLNLAEIVRNHDLMPIPVAKLLLKKYMPEPEVETLYDNENLEAKRIVNNPGALTKNEKKKRNKKKKEKIRRRAFALFKENPRLETLVQDSLALDSFYVERRKAQDNALSFEQQTHSHLSDFGFTKNDVKSQAELREQYLREQKYLFLQMIQDKESILTDTEYVLITEISKNGKKNKPKDSIILVKGPTEDANQRKTPDFLFVYPSLHCSDATFFQGVPVKQEDCKYKTGEYWEEAKQFLKKHPSGVYYLEPKEVCLQLRENSSVEPVRINWIDCKDLVGGINQIIDTKLLKQAEEYYRIFGSGAILFKHGYTNKFLTQARQKLSCNQLVLLSSSDFLRMRNREINDSELLTAAIQYGAYEPYCPAFSLY